MSPDSTPHGIREKPDVDFRSAMPLVIESVGIRAKLPAQGVLVASGPGAVVSKGSPTAVRVTKGDVVVGAPHSWMTEH